MKFVNIALAFILFRSLTVSAGDRLCENWYRYEFKRRVKYMTFPMKIMKWRPAKRFCEGLGGQLLMIPDQSTADFLLTYVELSHNYNVWFGVSVIDSKMHWVDGTIPNNKDYQNWEEDTIPQNGWCGSVNWNRNDSGWRLEPCKKKRFFSCEADVPCDTRPAIMIGKDGKRRVKGNINITMEQTSNVRCYASGYTANVNKVQLICSWNKIELETEATSIDRNMLFDLRSHMGMCECKVHEKDEKTKAITLTVIFYTSPQFVHDSDANIKIFTILIGHGFDYPVDMYANPTPEFFELTVNGTIVDNGRYNMSMEPLSGPLHFRVTITMFNLSLNESGAYVFAVDNYVKNALKSRFTLHVVKEIKVPPDDKKNKTGLNIGYYWILVAVLALYQTCGVCAACLKGCKRKHTAVTEESTKSTKSKSTSHGSRPVEQHAETFTEESDMYGTDLEKETEYDDFDDTDSLDGGTSV